MGGLDSLDDAQHTLDAGLGVEHDGYQLYVSVDGKTLLDVAGGEARPGVAMDPSMITMWFSSGKVVTAIAVAQLWEQGRLGLDDRVVDYLPAFTNGKERATVRHLPHTRSGGTSTRGASASRSTATATSARAGRAGYSGAQARSAPSASPTPRTAWSA